VAAAMLPTAAPRGTWLVSPGGGSSSGGASPVVAQPHGLVAAAVAAAGGPAAPPGTLAAEAAASSPPDVEDSYALDDLDDDWRSLLGGVDARLRAQVSGVVAQQ
jgi:hypothetical protein